MVQTLRAVPFPRRLAWLWPAFVLTAALALSVRFPEDTPRLAHAALFDATLTTAALVVLVTPRRERHWRPLLSIVLRGVALAGLVFPLLRHSLWLEAFGLLVGAAFAWRGLRTPLPEGYAELDDLERVYAYWSRFSAQPRGVRLVLQDVLMLSHLVRRPRLPTGQPFGTRRGTATSATITLLLFATLVEGLLAHVLLARWNESAAWGWTALEVTGAIWLLAYARALSLRPVTVGERRLYLRSGLHWTGSTPLANVTGAAPYCLETDGDALSIAIDVKPNVTLTFAEPVRLWGLFGSEREARRVSLHLDEPGDFMAACQAK